MILTKLLRIAISAAAMLCVIAVSAQKYNYETVPGDPMQTKIYTLPNGLKLFMTVNRDTPRIQTNIAVRVGGKNDPAATTGLAHYFEHLMFKGTSQFGTSDYAAEKPMLDRIEQLFEIYRQTTDSTARAAIYHQIDSISYEASKLAIPNEYDKLMTAIGSQGTNAYTAADMTCYVENIPSNQLDNWAMIQADRFRDPVLRGFHTELETIYEEKNMDLTRDDSKMFDKLFATLYPNHPYGQQTVLGSQTHLKNPSITNIKAYHKDWYVPNNTAIVLAGDFDPDQAVDVITKYFGSWQPNPDLPKLNFEPETPITSPIDAEVLGQEAESLMLAWRFPAPTDPEVAKLTMVDMILCNGRVGLLDLDINAQQKALDVVSFPLNMADYTTLVLSGSPRENQTLEELREMLLVEIEKLGKGEFDESMIPGLIANDKLSMQRSLESNDARMNMLVKAYINGVDWADAVRDMDRKYSFSKEEIVDFARRNLRNDNYVAIYKRVGKDPDELKIAKPAITPIVANRDTRSDYLTRVIETEVEPIEPVFVDPARELTRLTAKSDIPVLYKKNDTNDVFKLTYVYENGSNNNPLLPYVSGYLSLLGTPDRTAEQIKKEFYDLACSYYVSVGGTRSYITLVGLSENMPRAMELMEDVIAHAVPDTTVWRDYAARSIKSRQDSKGNQQSNLSALTTYGIYGPEYVNNQPGNEELATLDPAVLTDALRSMTRLPHRIIYYGPADAEQTLATLNAHHHVPATLDEQPQIREFKPLLTDEPTVFVAPYDSNQYYMYMISNDGHTYDPDFEIGRRMYNDYFSGDMSSIVFQEMRERRSLAYSAYAAMQGVSRKDYPYTFVTMIATQNDKLPDAIAAFNEIINDMPQSEAAFSLARNGMENNLRTSRTIKDQVAWLQISLEDLGLSEPLNKKMFETIPNMTLADVVDFQQKYVKDRKYNYMILGRVEDLDMDLLNSLGKVVILTPEQIFGY